MYWADQIAKNLKERNLPLEWVDDMKTPSGKIHVGALRGIIVHDLIYRALLDAGVKAKYTYVFDNCDPMDALSPNLSKERFAKYLGWPLNKIPSPEPGFSNFAECYARDFITVFNKLGAEPEIIWASRLYEDGKMDAVIRECLDKAEIIRKIYQKVAGAKKGKDWYPFQVICEKCGKIGTTRVYDWDGERVSYCCEPTQVTWAEGCSYQGKISPFSGTGKLPWKVEWPAKWKTIGVTVEGAGKDHMSKGGSHDIARAICQEVLNYPLPYPFAYEWFLVRGKKMSTSKGVGVSAQEISEILPPAILRFLMVRTNYQQTINFDPGGRTIPDLFDEYDRCAKEFYEQSRKSGFGRMFELAQIDPKKPDKQSRVRFSLLIQWQQTPKMQPKITQDPELLERARYAKFWLERFASEEEKFSIREELPKEAGKLSEKQRQLLSKVANEMDKDWQPEKLQNEIYRWGKELGLTSNQTFQAIYLALLGKDHGPKAAWLILSLDKNFIKKRFKEATNTRIFKELAEETVKQGGEDRTLEEVNKIFYIDKEVKTRFSGMSVGITIIKEVKVRRENKGLEFFKKAILAKLSDLTLAEVDNIPSIVAYRKLFKAFGVDWHSRRPSADALLRRLAQGKGSYKINTLVDAYNLAVIEQKITLGAFDYQKISFPTVLRLAKEGEEAWLLGDSDSTKTKEGEMIYADQSRILTLDLDYRDAEFTKVTEDTKDIILYADGAPRISTKEVLAGLEKGIEYITKFCGGKVVEKFLVE